VKGCAARSYACRGGGKSARIYINIACSRGDYSVNFKESNRDLKKGLLPAVWQAAKCS